MVDPLEAILKFVYTKPTITSLIGNRIAAQHKFASNWKPGQTCLTVRYDGGTPENVLPVNSLRLEVMCYAADYPQAFALWAEIQKIARETQREIVRVSNGSALIYWVKISSAPAMYFDPDLSIPCVLGFLECSVAEEG